MSTSKTSVDYTALCHALEAMYEEVVDALLNQPNLDRERAED